MKVKDAMHRGVIWVSPKTPVSDIARRMRNDDIGAVPVGDNDRLVGMVTDRDIACRAVADGRDVTALTAADVMTMPILYCREEDDIKDAALYMEKHQVRRLPVINTQKRMVGMLSLGDLSHKVPHALSGEVIQAVSSHHS
jgi:CBS domain-containing protein